MRASLILIHHSFMNSVNNPALQVKENIFWQGAGLLSLIIDWKYLILEYNTISYLVVCSVFSLKYFSMTVNIFKVKFLLLLLPQGELSSGSWWNCIPHMPVVNSIMSSHCWLKTVDSGKTIFLSYRTFQTS